MTPRDRIRALWRWAGSVGLFLWVAQLILMACVVGTLIPQGTDARILAGRWGEWPLGVILALGLNEVFYQWWFLALLGVFGVNLIACSTTRARVLHGSVWTTHIGMVVIMAGGIVTGTMGEKARLTLFQDEPNGRAVARGGAVDLPFEVILRKFTIEYHGEGNRHELISLEGGVQSSFFVEVGSDEEVPIGGKATVRIREFYPDFAFDSARKKAMSRSREPNNPAVVVEIKSGVKRKSAWLFQNHPDFYRSHGGGEELPELYYRFRSARIKQYVSDLAILESGETVKEGSIAVNKPMSWRGYTLYQSSYDPENDRVSILQANRDPGVPVVYAGFVIMPAGLLWALLRRRRS